MALPKVLLPGNVAKAKPFTVAIIANPVLVRTNIQPAMQADPIMADEPSFDQTAAYIVAVLQGALPGQAEPFLSDPSIAGQTRIISLFPVGAEMTDSNALIIEEHGENDLLVPRRDVISQFVAGHGIDADVVYAISKSDNVDRASAYPASDDDTQGGVPFSIDGINYSHRYFSLIPGTIALHVKAESLTALHEFGHAVASYANGSAQIVDLYVDSDPAVNCKQGRPIPASFCTYNVNAFLADQARDGIGYEPGWSSYHCELNSNQFPAIMDNYWQGNPPEQCQHDKVTREFLLDRIRAKMSR